MDGGIAADPAQRHVHDLADSVPVNVVHGKCLDAVLPQDLLLALVYVAEANVYNFLGAEAVVLLQPSKRVLALFFCKPRQECHGHAVDVSTVRCLGRVDVCVCIHPDDGNLLVEPLPYRSCGARNGTNRNRMVTSKGKDQFPAFGMIVHLLADLSRHSADELGLLHVAVDWILGRHELGVVVHLAIEADCEVQIIFELLDQTVLDKGLGRRVDTGFGLRRVSCGCQVGSGLLTCPPLKPTATTPKSWRLGRNLGCICGADVMLVCGCFREPSAMDQV